MSEKLSLPELFAAHDAEHGKFDEIEKHRHPQRELCAMLYIHERFAHIVEPMPKAIAAAEHGKIWLGLTPEMAEQLTKEDVIYLLRCGVQYDAATQGIVLNV